MVRTDQSRSCDDERGVEVTIDDKRGKGIVLANLVLLSIDKFGHHLIKVDACVCLAAHFLHVKLVLE